VSSSAAASHPHANVPSDLYVVLDADDRISYVSAGLQDELGGWVGHIIWDHLPKADSVYGPLFDEARATGRTVQSVVFYAGRVKRLTAIPAADGLAVHVERLEALDVRTLGTLAESLDRVARLLGAPAHAQPDSPAHGSLRALP
jgi:hypothetical protein